MIPRRWRLRVLERMLQQVRESAGCVGYLSDALAQDMPARRKLPRPLPGTAYVTFIDKAITCR
jgi:hypothetical protein